MASSLIETGFGLWEASEQADAQEQYLNQQRQLQAQQEQAERDRQAQVLAAQKKAEQQRSAAQPGQQKTRKSPQGTSAEDMRVRGIQATMLASRRANAEGGKSKLGE